MKKRMKWFKSGAISFVLSIVIILCVSGCKSGKTQARSAVPTADTEHTISGWYTDENGIYLFKPDGSACNGWVDTDKGIRYFESDGRMAVGLFEQPGGLWYFRTDGSAYTGWFEGKYCFDRNGKALTGWQEVDGQMYYFFPDGVVAEGWQNIDGVRYCFDEGVMRTGWYTEDNTRYYFHENGAMAVGETEIDGVTRFFTADGKYVVLVNFEHPVPSDYELNLVDVEGHLFDAEAADDLMGLLTACRAAGHPCYINNAYRSVETQQYMFNKRLNSYMDEGMDEYSAILLITESLMLPGHSEHHLGLAIDVRCSNAAYKWLEENGWQYGFILRYPEDKSHITGVIYEPWHFRYVGTELATELYFQGLTMEEYMEEISMSTYHGQ